MLVYTLFFVGHKISRFTFALHSCQLMTSHRTCLGCVMWSSYASLALSWYYYGIGFVSDVYTCLLNLKTYQFITMCKGDINRHQPKTAKINLGLNHHVLNSRTALTRRAIWILAKCGVSYLSAWTLCNKHTSSNTICLLTYLFITLFKLSSRSKTTPHTFNTRAKCHSQILHA